VCDLCDTKKVEDEKHFLLDFLAYSQIRSQFKNSFHNTNLSNPLSHQNYGYLGKLLSLLALNAF